MNRILIVDDEPGVLRLCEQVLRILPEVEIALEGQSARAADRITNESFDLMIVDICLPQMTGIELLQRIREIDPGVSVVMISGYPTLESAVESMKLGAVDFLAKPFTPEQLLAVVKSQLERRRLKNENRLLRRQMERSYCCGDILGQSAVMQRLCERIQKASETNFDVVIIGETGTGKELVARSIHRRSQRRERPFVPVNCGAIPEELLEREFFGHERGAFTGAQGRSLGLLEYAHQGTFFLDEINQLPLRLQGKLLRVVQERRLRRLGGTKEIEFDVRILAASSVSLAEEMRHDRFRADLYHRINVLCIEVPPLRERAEDIPILAQAFLRHFGRDLKRGEIELGPDVFEVLMSYSWPGNVRELQNVIKRTLAMANGNRITVDDLPEDIVAHAGEGGGGIKGGFFELRDKRLLAFEKEYFGALLRQCQGDVAAAAREAHLPRGTFYRLLKKHAMNPAEFRSGKERQESEQWLSTTT